jgi:hypothetical protein
MRVARKARPSMGSLMETNDVAEHKVLQQDAEGGA